MDTFCVHLTTVHCVDAASVDCIAATHCYHLEKANSLLPIGKKEYCEACRPHGISSGPKGPPIYLCGLWQHSFFNNFQLKKKKR